MRTRRQTVIRGCESAAGWAKIKLATKGGVGGRKWSLFGGAKGKCNLIKYGWTSRQRA